MKFHSADDVRLILPQSALSEVFDECDRFDVDETGGRVIGTFKEHGGKLVLSVTGIIEPGPQAQRSPVSFFQDGEYQENLFRKIERRYPDVEHLGNWHTHHVNGLSHLSGGDLATYRRIVNHDNHNTPFFYAMLVVAKRNTSDPHQRYTVKHYLFRRDDERVYEIPAKHVEIVNSALVWPETAGQVHATNHEPKANKFGARPERVYDRDILGDFYSEIRSFASKKLGVYWRGPLVLLDGSKIDIVLVETPLSSDVTYSIALKEPPEVLKTLAETLAERQFPSARAALIMTERSCNQVLYDQLGHLGKTKSSK